MFQNHFNRCVSIDGLIIRMDLHTLYLGSYPVSHVHLPFHCSMCETTRCLLLTVGGILVFSPNPFQLCRNFLLIDVSLSSLSHLTIFPAGKSLDL